MTHLEVKEKLRKGGSEDGREAKGEKEPGVSDKVEPRKSGPLSCSMAVSGDEVKQEASKGEKRK